MTQPRITADFSLVSAYGQRGIPLPILMMAMLDEYGKDNCWPWTSSVSPTGYAKIQRNNKGAAAHRAFYEEAKGEIPAGLHIDHLCRVHNCVNPAHLEAVTPRENTLRGLSPTSINYQKLVCKNGHDLVGGDVRYYPNGRWRGCRECLRIKGRRATQDQYLTRERVPQLGSPRTRLTADQVREIRATIELGKVGFGIRGLAVKYGVCHMTIRDIYHRKTWKDLQ